MESGETTAIASNQPRVHGEDKKYILKGGNMHDPVKYSATNSNWKKIQCQL